MFAHRSESEREPETHEAAVGAQVLAPTQSAYAERSAQECTALRAHKWMTIERAREVIADTTAHTNRLLACEPVIRV